MGERRSRGDLGEQVSEDSFARCLLIRGLTLAARPRSTIQISPRRGSGMFGFFVIEF